MVHGIVGAWLSSPRTFIGSWSVVGFSALWYLSPLRYGIIPLWGLIRLLSGFPSTDIILPLWGKTKWVMYEFFHPFPIVGYYHVPLRHGIVGTRKPSPRTFIGQWVGYYIPSLCMVLWWYGGMYCRHCA